MKREDLKVTVIDMKRYRVDVTSIHGAIVKIEHIPSGIVVTKQDKLAQHKAKEEALKELEQLVNFWSRKEVE